MSSSVWWFLGIASFSLTAWWGGYRLGKRSVSWRRVAGILAILLIVFCGWMTRRPNLPLHWLPADMVSALEGVAAVPFFMLLMGIAFACSHLPRHKRLTLLAGGFGILYFLSGGMWMLQTTPSQGLAQTTGDLFIMQSDDYSCVPAASAMALNQLGIPSSEAEMAQLTQTRVGSGSTIVRAVAGLERKLTDANSPLRPRLMRTPTANVPDYPMPALTTMAYTNTVHHMIVIEGYRNGFYTVSDPQVGRVRLWHEDFDQYYTGNLIVFE